MHLFSDFPPSLGRFIPWPVALPSVVKDGRTASSDLPGSDPGSVLASPSLTRLPLSRRSTLVSPWAHLEEPPGRGRSRHPGPRPFRPAGVPSRLQGSIRAPLRDWSVAAGDVPSVFVDQPSTPGDIALLSSSGRWFTFAAKCPQRLLLRSPGGEAALLSLFISGLALSPVLPAPSGAFSMFLVFPGAGLLSAVHGGPGSAGPCSAPPWNRPLVQEPGFL